MRVAAVRRALRGRAAAEVRNERRGRSGRWSGRNDRRGGHHRSCRDRRRWAAAPLAIASYNGCTDLAVLNLSWYYTWNASTNCTSNAQFVPQLWGHSGENLAGEISTAASKGYPYVLGFNEPDNSGQANMTVAAAIALWPQLTSNKTLQIGSPATSANSAGQTWFTSFMNMVNADTTGALRVDFIAMHWYGWNAGSCEASAATLESYIKWVEAIPGNRPIWITEWGCLNVSAPTAQGVQTFLSGAITMLAKHPRVVRYGWFESRTSDPNTTLVNSDGTLTGAGTVYADRTRDRSSSNSRMSSKNARISEGLTAGELPRTLSAGPVAPQGGVRCEYPGPRIASGSGASHFWPPLAPVPPKT